MSAYTPYIARVRPGGSRDTTAPSPQPQARRGERQPEPSPSRSRSSCSGLGKGIAALPKRGTVGAGPSARWLGGLTAVSAVLAGRDALGFPAPNPGAACGSQVASAQPAASQGTAQLPCCCCCCSSTRQKGFWFPALPAATSPLAETASGVLGCCEEEPVPGLGEGGQSPPGSPVPLSSGAAAGDADGFGVRR